MLTPIAIAVINNHISTAEILLARGANPEMGPDGDQDKFTVIHLACALGFAEMAKVLLAAGQTQPDPTGLLTRYGKSESIDAPPMVKLLLSHHAKVSDDLFYTFLDTFKWQSASELLQSTQYRQEMSRRRASDLAQRLLCSRRLGQDTETAQILIRQLLDLGASVSLGMSLIRQGSEVDFPTTLQLLPPFLDAGMHIKPGSGRKKGTTPYPTDLLGLASGYDKSLDDKGWAAQLSVVRLMLKHGAPIRGSTRGDAMDPLGGVLEDGGHGRRRWAFKLCNVLLEHCHQTPQDEQGKDIVEFLRRASGLSSGATRRSSHHNQEDVLEQTPRRLSLRNGRNRGGPANIP